MISTRQADRRPRDDAMTDPITPAPRTSPRPPAHSTFTRKVAALGDLSDADLALLDEASEASRAVAAGRDLISEGDRPGPVFVVLDGWACRYKILPDGGRQII